MLYLLCLQTACVRACVRACDVALLFVACACWPVLFGFSREKERLELRGLNTQREKEML
jgi:hypothetical protein